MVPDVGGEDVQVEGVHLRLQLVYDTLNPLRKLLAGSLKSNEAIWLNSTTTVNGLLDSSHSQTITYLARLFWRECATEEPRTDQSIVVFGQHTRDEPDVEEHLQSARLRHGHARRVQRRALPVTCLAQRALIGGDDPVR